MGPSECGLSAVEVLLSDKQLHFSSITLLCPEEYAIGSVGDVLTGNALHKLGLACRVNLVAAEMVSLDREDRRIGLSNGEEISYDYLLLTAGLKVKMDVDDHGPVPHGALLSCDSHTVQSLFYTPLQDQTKRYLQRTSESSFSSVVTMEGLLANTQNIAEDVQKVIVYGATLEAFHAMNLLVSKGGGNLRAHHVIPEATTGVVACVQKVADLLNLNIQEPTVMTLVEVEEVENQKLICAFEVLRLEKNIVLKLI